MFSIITPSPSIKYIEQYFKGTVSVISSDPPYKDGIAFLENFASIRMNFLN